MTPSPAPLAGIRVADFSELLPGPFLTQSLVELGAEVLKIERPPHGDPVRRTSPGLFGAVNRGKRSIVIDLKAEAGRLDALAVVDDCDVLVEGFRPGVMQRLGLGYETLAARNGRLIYLSLSGYGQESPLAQVPGHDLNYLAMAGVTSLCGEVDGGPAHTFGLPVADLGGAIYGLSAILAALYQREKTGEGQHLDLSMTDCMAHWLNVRRGLFHHAQATELAQQRRMALSRPAYGVFPCRDGTITIAALEGHFWSALRTVLGLTPFAGAEFDAIAARTAACAEINEAIAAAVAPMRRDEAVALLLQADVPVAPVLSIEEAAQSEHFRARNLMAATSVGDLTPFPVRLAGMEATPAETTSLAGDRTRQE
jgi:CoA:oxalate CoA-transferase